MNRIKVQLLHYTSKEVLIEAMSIPYQTDNFKNISIENAMKKIKAICVDKKHGSVLEHINFNFKIEGISRLCLQELVRHRLASYTVQSTRFTLPKKEKINSIMKQYIDLGYKSSIKENIIDKRLELIEPYIVIPNNLTYFEKEKLFDVTYTFLQALSVLKSISNDRLKYVLPESWRTNLVMSINIRSLRNFLYFRLDKQAHFEIRYLANLIFEQIPEEYKILFEDLVEK